MSSKFNQCTAFLKLSASKLVSKDLFSKSDPFVVVFMRNRNNVDSKFTEVGRTETLDNNANPDFKTLIEFPYNVHDMQELKFQIYDSDSSSKDLSKHDLIHEEVITVSDLLKRGQGVCTFTWGTKGSSGGSSGGSSMTARYERGTNNNDSIRMDVSCKDLPKMDLFGKVDPFFVIEHLAEDGKTWIKSFTSDVIKSNYNPQWKIDQTVRVLCNGGLKAPVKISVWDWDSNSAPDFIGSVEVSFDDLVKYRDTTMEIVDPKKHGKKRGSISFNNVVMTHVKSFADLIKEGLNLNVHFAVDFTGSNGDVESPDSLHYVHTAENQYQESIRRIGEVLIEYDTDKDIPLFGFGGQFDGENDVSHCYRLKARHDIHGLEKALDSYKHALSTVVLNGPTLFQEVIENAMIMAQSDVGRKGYHILTILTDGTINDMKKVKELLVSASSLPLSVIIIGVGNADFADMNELDSDGKVLTDARGFKAQRDIVQFVALKDVRRKGDVSLGQTTLAELPAQVETYYRANKEF